MNNNLNHTKGIFWILFAHLSLSVMAPLAKIVAQEISVFVLVFLQSLISFFIVAAFGISTGNFYIKTKRILFHFVRSICGTTALGLTFFSLSKMPVNQFVSITFTSAIFGTIFAAIILKEKIGFHRASAVIIGFIGAVIILKPSLDISHTALFTAFSASLLFGILGVLFKLLIKTEKIFTIIFYLFLFSIILTAPFAYYHWETPDMETLFLIALIGLVDAVIITAFIKAFSYAEISFLAPFEFSKLIFASTIAYFVFNEKLGIETIIGSIVIVGSNAYITRRETRLHHNI